MSKRKAGVNNIIYELDNDDIEISSEDEGKQPKINRLESETTTIVSNDNVVNNENTGEVINLDFSDDAIVLEPSPIKSQNGGKSPGVIQIDDDPEFINDKNQVTINNDINNSTNLTIDNSQSSVLIEDIIVDSPESNSDLGVIGCENRTPLFTVRFKNKKVAKLYKEKLKAFMLKLIKLHDEEAFDCSETETDLELDVWPEDAQDDIELPKEPIVEDNLFFIDTDPSVEEPGDIPRYRQALTVISNTPEKEPSPPPVLRRGPTCFNCDGAHPLRDCKLPRDNARIADKRKNMVAKVGRYHVEDEQKYGHLVPGRISGNLRHALGLKRSEIPLYIYRMRMLGYPPGWLEEARISHSGITMFDSTGNAIQDPEEEEGEVSEPGSKDKFDIKKILDFPGFNVPASSRYREEAHLYGLPPMSEQDSKIVMLQSLAPNAMKAYKRKKLTFFPSAGKATNEGQAEMELDSGDEVVEFPSVPPLPDDAPPPPPPPPELPPPPPESPPPLPSPPKPSPPETTQKQEQNDGKANNKVIDNLKADEKTDSGDDLEIVGVTELQDIPMPADGSHITIDDDADKSEISSSRDSPSLDDLEERKRLLLNALEGDVTSISSADMTEESTDVNNGNKTDVKPNGNEDTTAQKLDSNDVQNINRVDMKSDENSSNSDNVEQTGSSKNIVSKSPIINVNSPASQGSKDEPRTPTSSEPRTPTTETKGSVKTSSYGTPVLNIASRYVKLPSDDKFAKDICDVINFENLPDSTGKYKKISSLLKKVKSEVDRIQDS